MKKLNRSLMVILSIVFVIASVNLTMLCAIDILDRNIFPGCKVLNQTDDVLTIRLNPELATGTDEACFKAAQLIEQICSAGYKVQIWNRVIDLHEARILVELGGDPAPLGYQIKYKN